MTRIAELRRKTQTDTAEPPVYRIFRFFSIYFTLVLLRLPISPDAVTISWVLCLGIASLLFAVGANITSLIAGAFIALYYVLDCVDGEIARAKGCGSKLGSQLEQIGHWSTHGLLIIGIVAGQTSHKSPLTLIIVLGLSMLGDYCYHFTFYQLNLLFDRSVDYGYLHTFTRFLYRLMPINTNIFLLFSFFSLEWYALIIWATISNISWLAAFGLYYKVEVGLRRNQISQQGDNENLSSI